MMMFYLVRVDIDADIADDWQEWMKDVHLPDVVETGCFKRAWITRRPEADERGRRSYRMVYLAESREDFQRYQNEYADELQNEHTERYAGMFDASRELLDVVDEFEAESPSTSSKKKPAVADLDRTVTDAFEHPLFVETTDEKFFALPGPTLEVSDDPQLLDEGGLVGAVRAVHYVGDSDALFLFSDQGRYFGVDRRQIPTWEKRGDRRSIRDILFLSDDEGIRTLLPRRALIAGRIVHVTRGGKGKATDYEEYGRALDRSGRTAFKVRDGDVPVAVMGIPEETTIFCASAFGRGIHFEASELRSMGRKAIGVNVIKLAGDDDAVVGAFEGRRVKQLAVVTEQGLAKRVDFSEFRTQGRAGKGMQLAKLNRGDRIAGAVPCNPAEDVAVTTDHGQIWRLPAGQIPMMGRPAKGNRLVELADGERVIDLTALPCGG